MDEVLGVKRGAGVIPFCVRGGKVRFLFHKTFSGRRAGCLVDFGGGAHAGESHRQTAMREFIEETETMFFSTDIGSARRSADSIRSQTPVLEALFENTLREHPDWWCPRKPVDGSRSKDWKTFFVEFEYRAVGAMNRVWASDGGERFIKRRELLWVPAAELHEIYELRPERLWKRLRQLENAPQMIQAIRREKETAAPV